MSSVREVVPISGKLAAIGATALALTSLKTPLRNGLLVKADYANAGIVYIGGLGVTADSEATTDGFPLKAGETMMLEISDPSLMYAIASTTGQVVWFIGA